jgi:hypothetical protein
MPPCIPTQFYHSCALWAGWEGWGGTEQHVVNPPNHPHHFFWGPDYYENIKTDVNKISIFQGVLERNPNAKACLFGKVTGLKGYSDETLSV